MATPTEEMQETVTKIWLKKMSPIWPNLVKKESGFNYPKRDKSFFSFSAATQSSIAETVCIPRRMFKKECYGGQT